jgi:HD superfamily phosphodiesterase
MSILTIPEIEKLTFQYGDNWALAHAHRLLRLAAQIGLGLEYRLEAFTWAVYLHDWGAFPDFSRPGVEHARSRRWLEVLPAPACLTKPEPLF